MRSGAIIILIDLNREIKQTFLKPRLLAVG